MFLALLTQVTQIYWTWELKSYRIDCGQYTNTAGMTSCAYALKYISGDVTSPCLDPPPNAAHFQHGLAMIFLRDSFCLSAVFLSRQRHDILDFSCGPLSRVLQVVIWKKSDLSFIWTHYQLHLVDDRSINRLLHYFLSTRYWRHPKRSKQLFLAFNLDSIMSLPR